MLWGLPLCARLVRIKLCAGRVWSISTLHVGPDQPDPRPNPNLNPNPNTLGGSRSAGSVLPSLCRMAYIRVGTQFVSKKASSSLFTAMPRWPGIYVICYTKIMEK